MSRASVEMFKKRQAASALIQKLEQKNRPSEAVSFHQTGMPPHILRLFEARPAPPFMEKPRRKKPLLPYTGVSNYVEYFSEPGTGEHRPEGDGDAPKEDRLFINPEFALQCRIDGLTRVERMVARTREKQRQNDEINEEAAKKWDPNSDPNVEGDPLKTLFVAHLSQDVSERKLRREFEEFGPIKRIRVVHDKYSGKPKGYAFIEFEEKEDMKEAYKVADGTRIEGKRCLVDVERGRTVPNWRPKRLGGGKGGMHKIATLPRDPNRQLVAKAVNAALGVDVKPPVPELAKTKQASYDSRGSRMKRDRHDDGRGSSYDRYEPRRGRGGERPRYREDRYGGRYGGISRGGDRYDGRPHDRYSDQYDREYRHDYDERNTRAPKRERIQYDDHYAAVPPPQSLGGPPPAAQDEPEEGEL
ncbi:hypothetical protein M9435_000688 [Picochlorum sp. BPE23]|nr:hypothetical protein M9435_000688 [Picochlorum sp. BPE23]